MGGQAKYFIGFNRVWGIGPARIRSLLEHFGDLERAWKAPPTALRKAGLGPKTVAMIQKTRRDLDLEAEVRRVEQAGFEMVTWHDAEYPPRLAEIQHPPPMLYMMGGFVPEDRWAVAIVGTRQVTSYGRSVTEIIASHLAANGITIVSGLARGVDGIAHRAALQAGGRTIAVLGSGLDYIYPPEHEGLVKDIQQKGAVLSDYPLGTLPEPTNFPPRNRIISGLSLAVVVTEAGERSGALITASFAADQGRDVMAVPGDVTRPTSQGCNRLIRDGAQPVASAEDVLQALDLELMARHEAAAEALPEDSNERTVLQVLNDEPQHVDEIYTLSQLTMPEITASLSMLELKGRVRHVGGMKYIRLR
jgi:DNA processing protein